MCRIAGSFIMPHPLPEDIDSVSGLKWFLAAVPDDPAFTRAAWDVFTELANYWKWGKEGPVPEDSDKAAQLWSTAVYETIEAYQMGFPDVLLGYIDEVEDLLRALQSVPCCDAPTVSYQGDYDPNTQSEIEDGVGDPPATYGDDPITTWAEWDDYKCEASYFMVERAAALCEDLADIASWDTPLNAEIIGLALGRIPGVGDVFKAAWELVWQLLELSWDTIVDLETAASEIRAAADDIACDVFLADGPDAAAAAFKSAVQTAVTQTGASLVVPWFPYTMWANIIYEGTFVNAEGTTVAIDGLLTPGTNDCCCASVYVLVGTKVDNNTIQSVVDVNDHHAVDVRFNYDGDSYCGATVTINSLSAGQNVTRVLLFDQSDSIVYDDETPLACNAVPPNANGEAGVGRLRVAVSDGAPCFGPFTITMTFS